jgi:FSR family fosmidomycin resistance protein-like MFS transporter
VLAILLQSAILADKNPDHTAKTVAPLSGRDLLFSRTMLWFFGYYTLGAMGSAGVQAWLITVLHAVKGMDLTIASTALTGFMVGTTSGVLLGGWLSDNFRQHLQAMAIWLTLAGGALLLAVDGFRLPWPAVVGLMFAAGLALGTSRTPRDVMLKEASPPGQVGKVFGFVSAGLPLGSALTPVPFGMLIDHHHPELVLLLVAALLGAGLVCLASARASARAGAVAVAAE